MVEQQKHRVEHEISKFVDEIDRTFMRKMQGDMHRCSAKCCDNLDYSLDRAHSCIDKCGSPLNNANNYVQSELNRSQNKLQRCVMQCNDDIRDVMGPDPSQQVADKLTLQFEKCAVLCVDKYIDVLPNLMKTMKAVLAKGAPSPEQLSNM